MEDFLSNLVTDFFGTEISNAVVTQENIQNHFNRAFTHKTFIKQSDQKNDYEVYEKIGDAQLKISFLTWLKHLFNDKIKEPKYYDMLESYFTSKIYLANLSDELGLSEHILTNEKLSVDIKEDVFEAFVASLMFAVDDSYQPGLGMVYAMKWVHMVYDKFARPLIREDNLDFFKQNRSKLNELFDFFKWGNAKISHSEQEGTYYVVIKTPNVGPPKDVRDRIIGKGSGKTKVEAEEEAAKVAINTIGFYIREIRNAPEYFDSLRHIATNQMVSTFKQDWNKVIQKSGYSDVILKIGHVYNRTTYVAEIRGRQFGVTYFKTMSVGHGKMLHEAITSAIGKYLK